jgi:MoaA/NifB/PqqE/SkfB family radical SAM enzyme
MGRDQFIVLPDGTVAPCNVCNFPMGNVKTQTFDEIWNSEEARKAREEVAKCGKNCWMIGSASPAMKKHIKVPLMWILRNRRKYLKGCFPDV